MVLIDRQTWDRTIYVPIGIFLRGSLTTLDVIFKHSTPTYHQPASGNCVKKAVKPPINIAGVESGSAPVVAGDGRLTALLINGRLPKLYISNNNNDTTARNIEVCQNTRPPRIETTREMT